MRINLKRPNHKFPSCHAVGRHLTFPVTTTRYIPCVEFVLPTEIWPVIRGTLFIYIYVSSVFQFQCVAENNEYPKLICRSGDRASLQILKIKPTRCTNFSNLFFGIKLYKFRTVPLSITNRILLYTQQWFMP